MMRQRVRFGRKESPPVVRSESQPLERLTDYLLVGTPCYLRRAIEKIVSFHRQVATVIRFAFSPRMRMMFHETELNIVPVVHKAPPPLDYGHLMKRHGVSFLGKSTPVTTSHLPRPHALSRLKLRSWRDLHALVKSSALRMCADLASSPLL